MSATPTKVFIGSTRRDLADFRTVAIAVCRELDLEPIAMEEFEAMGMGAVHGSKLKLKEADVYVGIFAFRYGYVEEGFRQSVTEIEFEYAGERGLERLCLMAREDEWPDELKDPENSDKMQAFRDLIERTVIRDEFSELEEFRKKLTQALVGWLGRHSGGEVDAVLALSPEEVPDLPRKLVRRDELLDEIGDMIGAGDQVLLQGLGGFGKTVLAASAAAEFLEDHEEEDWQAVLWLRVGSMDADAIFEALTRVFDADATLAKERGKRARAGMLRSVLEAHSVGLVVLDDVWNGTALHEVLKALPRRMPVVVTSRQRYGLDEIIEIGPLTEKRALELLSANARKGYKTDADAAKLVAALGYHAFAVEIAGKTLKVDNLTPAELLEQIQEAPQSLRMPLGFAEAGRESVGDLLEISLQALNKEARMVFLAFGALFAASATPELLTQYMQIDADIVKKALKTLYERGLVEKNGRSRERAADYRLHDLAYSYAKMQASEREREDAVQACLAYLEEYSAPKLSNFAQLRPEIDNFMAAVTWAMSAGKYEEVCQFANLLCRGPDFNAEEGFLSLQGYASPAAILMAQAAEAAERLEDYDAQAGYWGNLGSAYRDLGQVTQAAAYYRKALALYRKQKNLHGEGLMRGRMGIVYRMMGKNEQSVRELEKALDIMREVGNRRWEGIILNNLGSLRRDERDYETALVYHEEALKIARRLKDRRGEGIGLRKVGTAYRLMHRQDEAIDFLEQALEMSRGVGDKRAEGTCLGNLGLAYRDRKEFNLAKVEMRKALDIAREVGDKRGEGINLGNLASIHRELGELNQAKIFYKQALNVDTSMRNRIGKAINLGRLGDIMRDEGESDAALEHYDQALRLMRRERNSQGTVINLSRMGETYRQRGDWERARDCLEESLELRRQMNDPEWEAIDLGNLGRIYGELGEYQQALDYLNAARTFFQERGLDKRLDYIDKDLATVRDKMEVATN